MTLNDLLFGKPLRSSEEAGEKLGPVGGLSVFGLDALSDRSGQGHARNEDRDSLREEELGPPDDPGVLNKSRKRVTTFQRQPVEPLS